MKIKDYIKAHDDFTSLASNVSRQLIFSGIAFIWIFKTTGTNSTFILPNELFLPSSALILSLCLDLFQYLVASIIWYFFYRYHENKRLDITEDIDIEAPAYLNYIINFFFYTKIISVLFAYYFLFNYVVSKICFN
ncbi:MAG: hypothetical protein K2P52_07605 [Campylobacterales bacterium]|nr:hypothetical protein [Campylobacterales bacterium]